jgi:hypothetical protein
VSHCAACDMNNCCACDPEEDIVLDLYYRDRMREKISLLERKGKIADELLSTTEIYTTSSLEIHQVDDLLNELDEINKQLGV